MKKKLFLRFFSYLLVFSITIKGAFLSANLKTDDALPRSEGFEDTRNIDRENLFYRTLILPLMRSFSFVQVTPAYAAFAPGETLDPNCFPEDPDCKVEYFTPTLNVINSTTTNATTTNFYTTNITGDQLYITNATTTTLYTTELYTTNILGDELTINNATTTNFYSTLIEGDTFNVTNATTTNLFSNTILGDELTITNATTTNFYTTELFTTNSTTTNLYASTILGDQITINGIIEVAGPSDSINVGKGNTTTGCFANSFGAYNTSSADYASTAGYSNTASSSCSSAFGYCNTASGYGSSAFGYRNTAFGVCSLAVGACNRACGNYSVLIGNSNVGIGNYSTLVGFENTASGYNSVALGYSNDAVADHALAVGFNTYSAAYRSTAFGYYSEAYGQCSSAFGHRLCVTADGASIFGGGADGDNYMTNSIVGSTMIGPRAGATINILSSGNVGIGTTTPEDKLVVDGTLGLTGTLPTIRTSSNRFSVNETGSTPGDIGMVTQFSSGPYGRSLFAISHTGVNTAFFGLDDHLFSLGGEGDTDIRFKKGLDYGNSDILNSGTELMRIVATTGNVGIGTSTPENKLVVNGNASVIGNVYSSGGISVDYSGDNGLGDNTLSPQSLTFGVLTGEGISSNRTNVTAGTNFEGLDFYTNYINRLSIANGTGNVGIGTNDPQSRLHLASNNDQTLFIGEGPLATPTAGGYLRIFDSTLFDNGDDGFEFADSGSRIQIHSGDENSSVNILLNARDDEDSYFNAGNFGIGTTTPESKLVVYDASETGTYVGNGLSAITTNVDAFNTADLQIGRNGTSNFANLIYANSPIYNTDKQWSVGFRSGDNNYHVYNDSLNADGLLIEQGNNRATVNYFSSLHGVVVDDATQATSTFNGDSALVFGDIGSGEAIMSNRTNDGINFEGMDFYSAYIKRMSLTNGGNFGIGDYNPTEKLVVAGNAIVRGSLNVIQDTTNAVIIGDVTGNARGSCALDIQSGRTDIAQVASGDASTAVGRRNTASACRASAIGFENTASAYFSSAFGYCNDISGERSSGFGAFNTSSGYKGSAFGYNNDLTGDLASAFGRLNCTTATSSSAFGIGNEVFGVNGVAYGYNNTTCQQDSAVFGVNNIVDAERASAFGFSNTVSGYCSSVFGYDNCSTGCVNSAVGYNNCVSDCRSSAIGFNNSASAYRAQSVGRANSASGCQSNAFGGSNASCNDRSSAFGDNNTAEGDLSVAFGLANHTFASSTSAFGYSNSVLVGAECSAAFGYNTTVDACHAGAFGLSICNNAADSVELGFSNSDKIQINSTGFNLISAGTLGQNGGMPVFASDRNLKENFVELDKADILSKINSLDITQWNYKAQDDNMTHIGPMAQDFYGAFDLGNSSTSISALDPAGVALVGIQALSERFNELEASTAFISSLTLNVSTTTFAYDDESTSIWEALQSFGATVVDGIAYLKNIFVEKLTIGSEEKAGGITIYSEDGTPYCVTVSNGGQLETSEEAGTCEQIEEQAEQEVQNNNEGNDTENTEESTGEESASGEEVVPVDEVVDDETQNDDGEGDSDVNQAPPETNESSSDASEASDSSDFSSNESESLDSSEDSSTAL